jgi:opacity protein-like surface antigen
MKRVLLIVALVAAFAAPAALADNSTSEKGYGGQAQVQSDITKGGSGALPLTGTDLGLLVLGGGVFALAGLGMRRAGRNRK